MDQLFGRERELTREFSTEEKLGRLLKIIDAKMRLKAQELANMVGGRDTTRFHQALSEPIFTFHEMEAALKNSNTQSVPHSQ